MGLLPKDETFWEFFTKQTAALCLASDLLAKSANSGNSSLAGAAGRIKMMERESARTLRDLQVRLHKTFVTPIDPEDISLLFEHLDRLMDGLEAITYRMTAYHFQPVPPLLIQLAGRIHSSAELIEKAFGLLSLSQSTEDLCQKIEEREEETDHAIRDGITRLFEEEHDPILLLKQKEIYDFFERVSKSMQALSNALQNVSIKNS